MQPGTVEDAVTLAKQRWSQQFPFDLDEETWQSVFQTHRPGEVLQAIRMLRGTRSTRPEVVYPRFQMMLDRLSPQAIDFQNN